MTFKQFLYLLGGVAIVAIIYIIILVGYFFMTFSLAGQTLSEKEGWDSFNFFGCLFVISVTIYFIYSAAKSKHKFYAIGMSITVLASCYGLFVTGKEYIGDLLSYEVFDKGKWMETDYKSFKMAKRLIKDRVLIRQTKQQVIEMLGLPPGGASSDPNQGMVYATDYDGWEMHLHFKDGKLFEVYLSQPGLDL